MNNGLHDVPDYTRLERIQKSIWVILTTVYTFVVNKITHKRLWKEPMWLFTVRQLAILLKSGKTGNDLLKAAKKEDLDPQLRQDLSKYIK
jgi:hypothetical protein